MLIIARMSVLISECRYPLVGLKLIGVTKEYHDCIPNIKRDIACFLTPPPRSGSIFFGESLQRTYKDTVAIEMSFKKLVNDPNLPAIQSRPFPHQECHPHAHEVRDSVLYSMFQCQ